MMIFVYEWRHAFPSPMVTLQFRKRSEIGKLSDVTAVPRVRIDNRMLSGGRRLRLGQHWNLGNGSGLSQRLGWRHGSITQEASEQVDRDRCGGRVVNGSRQPPLAHPLLAGLRHAIAAEERNLA